VRRIAREQAEADRAAGLDWSTLTTPASALDDALRQTHTRLPIDLDDPAVWVTSQDRQHALARRLGLDPAVARRSPTGPPRTSTPSTPTTCAAGRSPHTPD
ncbi:MAG TPA: hypothetical protein VFZ00_32925, partial [Solirubrobacter sp.]|nr:hypothetical protein [Solirubrobacter sp.]